MQKNVSVKVRLRVKHLSTVILEKTDVRYTHVLGYWCFIVLWVRCLRHWRKGASPAIKRIDCRTIHIVHGGTLYRAY